MPHRPEIQGSSVGGIDSSTMYTPPRVAGSAAAAIMRQTTNSQHEMHSGGDALSNVYGARSSGVVTPVVKSKAWIGSSSRASSNEDMHHSNVTMMPSIDGRNKSSDSTDRSTGTTDDSRSIATLATEDEREATASALLMVAKAAEREHYLSAVSSSTSPGSFSTVPLKKRKKQMYTLRRNDEQGRDDERPHNKNTKDKVNESEDNANEQNPCHVSPVSHSSIEQGMVGTRNESIEDGTPSRRMNPPATNNSSHSYDSKDLNPTYRNSGMVSKGDSTQELLDSSKVHNTAQIGATTSSTASTSTFPSQVVIPHFPTVLHQVLDDEELNGNALQWLADGESWKVKRWDTMRREVLPKYFAELRDENGSSCGTIDAFLYHLDAWGFKEILNGANIGAYRHDLFIRGAQKLCVKMNFTSGSTSISDFSNDDKLPKTVSPGRSRGVETERSMLQVPVLASRIDSKNQAQPPNKRPRYDTHTPVHWPYSTSTTSNLWGGQQSQDAAHLRAYGMRAATAAAMSNPYSIDPRTQSFRGVSATDSISRQIPSQQHYNPPQVRSGRGALRLSTSAKNRSSGVSSPSTTPSFRNGFPVSNRGKGPRKPAACRTKPVVSQSEEPSSSESTKQQKGTSFTLDEAQRIGNAVNGVAVAVSRKTTRKLPLSVKEANVDVANDKSTKHEENAPHDHPSKKNDEDSC